MISIVDSKSARAYQLAFNSLGLLAPIVAALFAIPLLIQELQPDGFGLLTLFWVLIGYANIFELGLGRSMTRLLASRMGSWQPQDTLIVTGITIGVLLGFIALIILNLSLPIIFGEYINLPADIKPHALRGINYVTLAMPLLILSPVLLGILEAYHRFDLICYIRVPTGIGLFAAPAIVAVMGGEFDVIILSMLIVRVVSVAFLLILTSSKLQSISSFLKFDKKDAWNLLTYGGWLTVSAIIGPVLVYADRFLLASFGTLEGTAIYTTPFEAIVRFLVIPAAILGVFFPRFVQSWSENRELLRGYYKEANFLIFVVLSPFPFICWMYGPFLLEAWLKVGDFQQMARIGTILSIGLLLNAMAHVPQALVQAAGHARWTGILHVAELGFWLIYAPLIIMNFGAVGAAYSWLIRVCASTTILYILARRLLKEKVCDNA